MDQRSRRVADEGPAAPSGPEDERLAVLLEELAGRLRRGEAPDVEKAAREAPDLAAELRRLWPAVAIAEELARARRQSRGSAPVETATVAALAHDQAPPEREGLPPEFGGYRILEELGRGGMGVVYRARQESLDRTVALKVMLESELASDSNAARFRLEAESAARLNHPHIVSVYEVGSHQGRPYFTMRLVEGTTLARRLQDGPLPPREAAALLLPISRAIDHAHRQGVLHRDLKPSNILIDREGLPHVTDFGLARRIESDLSLTRSGAILGTPSYMSPEQAAGERAQTGPASDVYSLGAILYHMLTGKPPFQAASAVDTLISVLEEDPPLPRLVNPRADPELEMVALKCLQKPPDLRYPSAGALADDLAAYLEGEPVSARSTRVRLFVSRLLRETHHAGVLESWGLLWMWHSVALLALCFLTSWLHWAGVASPAPYIGLWCLGLGAWGLIFLALRRSAGPITFVERQVAHIWASSIIGGSVLFLVEMLLGLPVLTLSPVLAILSGMVFFIKAGILSGSFYFQAAALFLTAVAMARFPDAGLLLFGVVSAAAFFLPGWKYHRQRGREHRSGPPAP